MAGWCGPRTPLPPGSLLTIRHRALVFRLLPCAAPHASLLSGEDGLLRIEHVLSALLDHSTHNSEYVLWLTDGRNEVQETLFREERVLQSSEIQLQHSRHWVDVMLVLVVYQGIFTWLTTVSTAWCLHSFISIAYMMSVTLHHHTRPDSPLSNEFLISLTSTCDPGTRNMPCCCNPERNTSYCYLQTPVQGSCKPTGNT